MLRALLRANLTLGSRSNQIFLVNAFLVNAYQIINEVKLRHKCVPIYVRGYTLNGAL